MRTRHIRRLFPLAATLLAVALPLGPALARIADADPFAGLDPVGRSEMGELRGGMMVGGIQVDFAVVVRTTVQGAGGPMGLQTTLTLNDAGGLASAITTAVGGAVLQQAANGLAMVLQGSGTSISHQVLGDSLATAIANRAGGVTISQSTDLNVTMPGFLATSRSYFAHSYVAKSGVDAAIVGLGRF